MPGPKLPSISPEEAEKAFGKAGWYFSHQRGSHRYLRKKGMPAPICIPTHKRDLPKGTLRTAIRRAGMTRDQFLALL